ncbi:Amiloride-sensitive sodium channel [Nesidiocoris tenuis]|nr:Amiloride-sensitive sodium channel [Nesidiocoris tenuis]
MVVGDRFIIVFGFFDSRRSKGWVNSGKDFWIDQHNVRRPRRTAQHGPWSGLRFKAIPMTEDRLPPDGNHTTTGVVVTVADPKSELHNNYLVIAPGQEIRLPVWGDNLIATQEVKNLDVKVRNCLFPDEDPFGLPQGYYLAANCKAACFQNYTLKYCNCSPDFIFYNRNNWEHNYKPCDTSGLLCLSEFNDIFTYEAPPDNKDFFPMDKPGIECSCPPDCTSQLYVTELTAPSLAHRSETTATGEQTTKGDGSATTFGPPDQINQRGSADIQPGGHKPWDNKEKWFDGECFRVRKKCFALLNLCRRTGSSMIRKKYADMITHYKAVFENKKKAYNNEVVEKVAKAKDSKEFWQAAKALQKNRRTNRSQVPADEFKEHFDRHLNVAQHSAPHQFVQPFIEIEQLDKPFTLQN